MMMNLRTQIERMPAGNRAWLAIVLIAIAASTASGEDFVWSDDCGEDWHNICELGPCPTDPDKREYVNNFGKKGCSLQLPFPGPNDSVDLTSSVVELTDINVEILSLVSGGHFTLRRPLKVASFVNLSEFTFATPLGFEVGGNMVISGPFNWMGGGLLGAGQSTGANGRVEITSVWPKALHGRTLVCNAPVSWRDTGYIAMVDDAAIDSRVSFSIHTDSNINGNGGTFINKGILRKLDSPGETVLEAEIFLDNTDLGTIAVDTGVLRLDGGGDNRGMMSIADGATIRMNGGNTRPFTFHSQTEIDGDGLVWASGWMVAERDGIVAIPNLLLTGTASGPGNFLPRSMTWNAGTMTGGGATEVSDELTITGSISKTINNHRLFSDGEGVWRGTGKLTMTDGGWLTNTSNFTVTDEPKTLDIRGSESRVYNSGALSVETNLGVVGDRDARIENTGTINITNAAAFNTLASLVQAGHVAIPAGRLVVGGGGQSSGSFDVGADGLLSFIGGRFDVNDGTTFQGSGVVGISGAAEVSANVDEVAAANVEILGGTLTGPGTLVGTELLAWIGGSMTGPGHTVSKGQLPISGNFNKSLAQRTLTNQGAATWTDTGQIVTRDGAVIDNQGSFDVQNNSTVGLNGGSATFRNSGTFRKSAGNGVTTIFPAFDSSGPVTIDRGVLKLVGGGTGTGTFSIARLGILEVASRDYILDDGAKVTGEGPLRMFIGSVVVPGEAEVDVETSTLSGGAIKGAGIFNVTGSMNWAAGSMQDEGTTRIREGASLTLTGNAQKACFGRTLLQEGSATWTGGNISLRNGSQWRNVGIFGAQSSGNILYGGGAVGSFLNEGTFRKTSAGNMSISTVSFTNSGTVDVRSGTLILTGGGRGLGTFNLAEGTAVEFSSDPYILDDARITGEGFARLLSGRLTIESDGAKASNFRQSAGTLDGPGTLDVTATLNWTGGVMEGEGTTQNSGEMTLANNDAKRLSGRTLLNLGTATYSGTNHTLEHGALWHNKGTLDLPSTGSFGFGQGDPATLRNEGLVKKTVFTRTTFQPKVRFDNLGNGTVSLQTGQLRMRGGGKSAGAFFLGPGSDIHFEDDYTFESGCRFVGEGLVQILTGAYTVAGDTEAQNFEMLSSAEMTGPGNFTSKGSFRWQGGTIAGPGKLIVESGSMVWDGLTKVLKRHVENNGSTRWSMGNVEAQDAIFDNKGSFDILSPNGQRTYTGGGASQILNRGTLLHDGSNTGSRTTLDVPVINTGKIVNLTDTLVFAKPFSQTAGSVTVTGGVIEFQQTTSIRGGTLGGNSKVNVERLKNGGKLRPGESPGELTLEGDYEQEPEGSLQIEMAGYAPGDEHDVFVVTGHADLGGTLEIVLLDGFEPQIGDMFTVMTFASSAGEFANVAAPCGHEFAVHYNANDVTLEVTAVGVANPGDLDGDCDVDLDDYRRFAPCIGGPGVDVPPQGCDPNDFSAADADGDRDVDMADAAAFGNRFTGD